jgi:hypothetical protein
MHQHRLLLVAVLLGAHTITLSLSLSLSRRNAYFFSEIAACVLSCIFAITQKKEKKISLLFKKADIFFRGDYLTRTNALSISRAREAHPEKKIVQPAVHAHNRATRKKIRTHTHAHT